MKFLVATNRTQGDMGNDYTYCVPGELLWITDVCGRDRRDPNQGCGCGRGFGGLSSHRATTTAKVADLEVTEEALRLAVRNEPDRSGLAPGGVEPRRSHGDRGGRDRRSACDCRRSPGGLRGSKGPRRVPRLSTAAAGMNPAVGASSISQGAFLGLRLEHMFDRIRYVDHPPRAAGPRGRGARRPFGREGGRLDGRCGGVERGAR